MELFKLFGSIFVDNEKANESIQKTDSLGEKLGKGFSKIGGIIGKAMLSAGAAITGVAVKGVHSADQLQSAVKQLGSQTGATEEEMLAFSQSMKNIYSNNFGESFEDIAQSMGSIYTQTGLTGDELEKATEKALMLRDTFEFDVSESTRAMNQLMKEFGISSEEAYTLIAQGAQNGLNANGDLMDVINEYSLHFNQLGFSSEEMFNMLKNGADTGAFSVDKLGDAMKEFGIRAKDGSDGTADAFSQLGLNADIVTEQFARGGEQAQTAFNDVVEALINTDDQVMQNQIGVALFGTMWEDLGAEAISSLSNVNGEFDKTKNTLEQINAIKYDTFGQAMAGIGRQIETGFFIPIGEKLLPKLNEFSNYIRENMPNIQGTIETVFNACSQAIGFVTEKLDVIIPLLAGAVAGFVAFKVISTVTALYTTLTTILAGVTTAQGLLNTVMAANPIGIVVVAIGALIAAGVALAMNWDEVVAACKKLWESLIGWFNDIKIAFDKMWQDIKEFAQDFYDAGAALFESIWDGIKDVWDLVCEWVGNMLDDPIGTIIDTYSKFFSLGADLIQNLWDGMAGIWDNLCGWVEEKVSWITDKLFFWNKAKDEMSEDSSPKSKNSRDGSHRNGLSYVPFDGYMAETHIGERILTKEENIDYTRMISTKVDTERNVIVDNSETNALLKELISRIDRLPTKMRNEKLFAM